MRRNTAFVYAGLAGAVALLGGLALDSYLHARDPSLAHREGVFTLTNPGHLMLGIGMALVVVGVVGVAYTTLPYGVWVRRGMLGGALLLVAVSGDISGWAASVQWTSQPDTAAAGGHLHSSGTTAAAAPTAAQLLAAAKLVSDTKAAVARYADLNAAIAAGYVPMEPPDIQVVHYVNRSYMTDQYVLDPQHIQSLIYFNGSHGPVLIGAMYIMPKGEDGPQIGGPLTVWHQHSNICFDDVTGIAVAFVHSGFEDNGADKSGSCPRGSSVTRTPQMLHVWLIDNPEGPFASTMDPDVLGTSSAIS